ncbi:hypothetical protein HSX11_02000 [Oxalobacteraceae bacterium]|nr:hypothetical protein [Oxalobacteraceae bacterium]
MKAVSILAAGARFRAGSRFVLIAACARPVQALALAQPMPIPQPQLQSLRMP